MKLTIGHLYPDLLNLYGDREYSVPYEEMSLERNRGRNNSL